METTRVNGPGPALRPPPSPCSVPLRECSGPAAVRSIAPPIAGLSRARPATHLCDFLAPTDFDSVATVYGTRSASYERGHVVGEHTVGWNKQKSMFLDSGYDLLHIDQGRMKFDDDGTDSRELRQVPLEKEGCFTTFYVNLQ